MSAQSSWIAGAFLKRQQTWKSTFLGYFGQAAPPYMGWVRFRYRRCSPAPQGSLHSVQGAQAPI